MFAPDVLDPIVDRLAALAAGGAALELAIGTGRVAIPLHARGVPVTGIELSPADGRPAARQAAAADIAVTIGDMATTRVDGTFALVYLVFNTIMNLTTQDEQVAVFANAAAHLAPGGCFVVEVVVPQLRRLPPGELGRVFDLQPGHVGIETFDDDVDQISWSHHWTDVDGRLAAALRAVPLRVAVRARPDGPARRAAPPRPLGRLARRAVHDRQPERGRRLREVATPASRRSLRAGAGCGTRRRRRCGCRTRRRSSRRCSSTTSARGSASRRGAPCGASP